MPAAGYVIADAGTGAVLAAKDPHGRFRPAGTLQILTADTLIPVLRPDATVADLPGGGPAPGQPRWGCWPAAVTGCPTCSGPCCWSSANDAAIALAQATGSYRRTVAMMNAEARHLRADDTAARQPDGLNARGQHSSAYDLALFARQALAIPALMRIEAERAATFPLSRQHLMTLDNQNTMLGRYRGDLGGKIGWTAASQATFIGWARRHGHTLIVTIMHGVPRHRADLRRQAAELGIRHGRAGQAGRHPGPPAARPRAGTQRRGAAAARRGPGGRGGAPPGFPAVTVAAGAGVLLALLVAGGIALAVRRLPRAGSPPRP